MAGRPVSLVEVVRAGVAAEKDELHTAMPGEVVAYDPLTNTAFIRPMVKHALYRDDGERVFEEYPDIPFVPIVWPRAGGKMLVSNLEPGDTVGLIFSESSLAEWRATGQLSEPGDARRHSVGWPWAVPGLYPDTKPLAPLDAAEILAGAMIVGEDGGVGVNQMIVGGTIPGIRFGKLAVMPVALAPPLVAAAQAAAASATAAAAADTSTGSALSALLAYIDAVVAGLSTVAPPLAAAVATPQATAAAAVTAAGTAAAATGTAATAGATAASSAAATAASTIVKAI